MVMVESQSKVEAVLEHPIKCCQLAVYYGNLCQRPNCYLGKHRTFIDTSILL